jgi:hypothetical protein
MKECRMDELDSMPEDFPTTREAQLKWFDGIADRLVERVWLQPSEDDLRVAKEAYEEEQDAADSGSTTGYCYCKIDILYG